MHNHAAQILLHVQCTHIVHTLYHGTLIVQFSFSMIKGHGVQDTWPKYSRALFTSDKRRENNMTLVFDIMQNRV